jgi:cyclopropane fatty-acyl-phospholipid synthase-like methyltransferase
MDIFNQASVYDNNSSAQREDGQGLTNLLQLEEGNVVLDLGCGTGYLTRMLANIVGCSGGKVKYSY